MQITLEHKTAKNEAGEPYTFMLHVPGTKDAQKQAQNEKAIRSYFDPVQRHSYEGKGATLGSKRTGWELTLPNAMEWKLVSLWCGVAEPHTQTPEQAAESSLHAKLQDAG